MDKEGMTNSEYRDYVKSLTGEQFLCHVLNSSREELQYKISQSPTRAVKAVDDLIKLLND